MDGNTERRMEIKKDRLKLEQEAEGRTDGQNQLGTAAPNYNSLEMRRA